MHKNDDSIKHVIMVSEAIVIQKLITISLGKEDVIKKDNKERNNPHK